MILQGNTDERGSREYNLALGQKRAEAVRKALALLGEGDAQMEAVSFGEEKPRNEPIPKRRMHRTAAPMWCMPTSNSL